MSDLSQTLEHIDSQREQALNWHRNGFDRLRHPPLVDVYEILRNETGATAADSRAVVEALQKWEDQTSGHPEKELASNLLIDTLTNTCLYKTACETLREKKTHLTPAEENDRLNRIRMLYQAEQVRNVLFTFPRFQHQKPIVLTTMESVFFPGASPRIFKQGQLNLQQLISQAKIGDRALATLEQAELSLASARCLFSLLQAKGTQENFVREGVVENLLALYQEMGLSRYTRSETMREALGLVEAALDPVALNLNKIIYTAIGVPPRTEALPVKSYVIGHWGPTVNINQLIGTFGSGVVAQSLPHIEFVASAGPTHS